MKTSQFRTKHIKIEAFQCQFAVAFRKWEHRSEEPINDELVNVFPDKLALKKLLHKNVRGEWLELLIQISCQHLNSYVIECKKYPRKCFTDPYIKLIERKITLSFHLQTRSAAFACHNCKMYFFNHADRKFAITCTIQIDMF